MPTIPTKRIKKVSVNCIKLASKILSISLAKKYPNKIKKQLINEKKDM